MNAQNPSRAPRARRAGNKPAGRHAAGAGRKVSPNMNQRARRQPARKPGKASLGQLFRGMFPGLLKKRGPAKPRAPRNPENIKTALWLWCFPVGLSKMWRSACTWKKGVKIGITAGMAAILAAILFIPTPSPAPHASGVEMVANNPEVEVYGPALPSLIVPGYTKESTGSIIVGDVNSDVHYVYAADGARCYHEYECKFAFASSQRLTVYEAYHLGFEPCGRCNPPVYTPGSQLNEPGAETAEGDAAVTSTDTAADANAAPAV